MTKFSAFVIILALRIIYHPAPKQPVIAPFINPAPAGSPSQQFIPARKIIIDESIYNGETILYWVTGKNEKDNQTGYLPVNSIKPTV